MPSVLLARLPTLEHTRLSGHTGGNLLLSMMQQYSGDFLAAVDGLRGLLGCAGRVWPISVEQSSVCASYADGTMTRGEVEVDAAQSHGEITRIWLEPEVRILPAAAAAISRFEAAIIGPGSFYTSLMPNFTDQVKKWNMASDIDSMRQDDGKYYLLPGLHESVWKDYSIAIRTDVLKQLNLTVPKTWDEMVALSNKIVADGGKPWCAGISSGDATGWPVTDWMEDFMLRTAGVMVGGVGSR